MAAPVLSILAPRRTLRRSHILATSRLLSIRARDASWRRAAGGLWASGASVSRGRRLYMMDEQRAAA
jgi:hypothetical protein